MDKGARSCQLGWLPPVPLPRDGCRASRKPEQLYPSLPEEPHVHCEHSQHFLGWINNLGCSRSITEQSTPVT